MQQITLDTFKNYLIDLANLSPHVDKVLGTIEAEVQQYLTSGRIQKPFITLASYREDLSGNSQSTGLVIHVEIYFLEVPKTTLYQGLENLKSKNIALAKKFASRMNLDAKNPNHLLYNAFDKTSVSFEPIEFTEPQNLFGCVLTMELSPKIDFTVDPNDWTDSICRTT